MGMIPCPSIPLQPAVAGKVALGSQEWESWLYLLSGFSNQETGQPSGDGLDGEGMRLLALMT